MILCVILLVVCARDRLKFVENCIRLIEMFERSSWKSVRGLEDTLSAYRGGETMLTVADVNEDDIIAISEVLKTNSSEENDTFSFLF